MFHILVADDDKNTRRLMQAVLEGDGYTVTTACDGEEALAVMDREHIDLVVLDTTMPNMDGYEFTKTLRSANNEMPILMVSARREDIDKIRGLGLGADDYIEKPFSPSVLVARVKVHLARYQRLTGTRRAARPELRAGGLRLNTETRRVYVDDREVELKSKEYELLHFLLAHPDMVFSREELYERIWGLETMGDNATVAVHINRIREKIEADPSHPRYVQTVWGVGYRVRAQ